MTYTFNPSISSIPRGHQTNQTSPSTLYSVNQPSKAESSMLKPLNLDFRIINHKYMEEVRAPHN